jgi:hypothetical protein
MPTYKQDSPLSSIDSGDEFLLHQVSEGTQILLLAARATAWYEFWIQPLRR